MICVTECSCDGVGAISKRCDDVSGQCECNYKFDGLGCDRCKNGYFLFPDCAYCDCDVTGTEEEVCDQESGECACKDNFAGERCDRCADGFFDYPTCRRE